MKHIRPIVCITLALLLMSALFRPGCRIVIGGTPMPGIYDPAAVTRCAAAAERAAEEITRTAESRPFTLVPVLCLRREAPDEQLLTRVLLEAYPGVEKLYRLSAGDRPIGVLRDLRDIYRLRRAYPALDIRFKEVYTYAGAESDAEQVRAVLQALDTDAAGPF